MSQYTSTGSKCEDRREKSGPFRLAQGFERSNGEGGRYAIYEGEETETALAVGEGDKGEEREEEEMMITQRHCLGRFNGPVEEAEAVDGRAQRCGAGIAEVLFGWANDDVRRGFKVKLCVVRVGCCRTNRLFTTNSD